MAKIYFSDKVLLWVTQQPVTLNLPNMEDCNRLCIKSLKFSETRDSDPDPGDQEQGAGEGLVQQGHLAQQQRAHRDGPG